MTQEEAVQLAQAEAARRRAKIKNTPPMAFFKKRHMSLDKNRSGWVVWFDLDVPASFEPNQFRIEVYEPDGEIHVPDIL